MHFCRSFGVFALNVLHKINARNLYTQPNVRQHVSLRLQNPRWGSSESEHLNTSSEGGKREGEIDVNMMEHYNRRRMKIYEPQEMRESLYEKQEILSARGTLQKNTAMPIEKIKISVKRKSLAETPNANALDVETMNVLKMYRIKEKSVKVVDSKRKLEYLKLKQSDSLFGTLSLLVKSRKRRELKCKIILEGNRLIKDGIDAGLSADTIVFSDVSKLEDLEIDKSVQLVQVERHIMQEWSNLTTCPGVIGIFRKPQDLNIIASRNQTANYLPIIVICDNIREPNNLGSIIRSCAAIPVTRVVLLKGCTCPWDPKCLRGATGAQFRVPISGPLAIDKLEELIPPNATFLVADNKTSGNDGKFFFSRYDAANYHEMQHLVLFIGGETLGVSNEVRRFITGFKEKSQNENSVCYNIHIPLANGIESLNTASALSVLLYEIRRQLVTKA